ncbi:hypothetical protein ADK38_46570 [Streptomyces varsoviensis]|uniref:Uncharacterized protein n=1 Tax=Streptomyces varsoviensis TaxID=67373 RepID=A0ABR5IR94_9ACTN|nr:hypothetical protein ADK38_46570 [Streptomyces varsoviensis]
MYKRQRPYGTSWRTGSATPLSRLAPAADDAAEPAAAPLADTIESATDDEIFAYIDRQLGAS